ncbi:MAG: L,D-transpeptidase [Hyphomicrobium sp.]|uniref:L,D-transpeptidase n=1 Tax=Hyphomicrobium sp. TaxID=82 RepID=UPI0039E47A3B
MKAIILSIVAVSALAGSSTFAQAQQWDPWDGPRRPVDRSYQPDDDRYDSQDDERYFDQQDGPRANNRYGDPDNDPRRYDPRYNADRDDDYATGRPYTTPRAYRDDGYRSRGYDDRDDGYGAWDAAPSRDEEERLSKSQGVSGGARPPIRAVAPPKVAFSAGYAPGSIVIDTSARKLYYVLSSNTAYAYPIGVGRQGFAWTGKEKVSRIADWPDWYPPADMRQRRPELPVRMLGGIRNPLGAKAIYLGNTLYRIHGTNEPKSIGTAASSGCFRMMNENVLHLASLVHVGTEVTIVRSLGRNVASAAKSPRSETKEARKASPQSPAIINRNAAEASDDWDPYNGWH